MLSEILVNWRLYLILGVGAAGVVAFIVFVICGIIKCRKQSNTAGVRSIVISVLCVLIACCAWIFNMGWLRFIMTILQVPVIYTVIFIISTVRAAPYSQCSERLRRLNVLCCITYDASYILLPDGGDTGELYCIFGLIKNDTVAYILAGVAPLCAIASIILMIMRSKECKILRGAQNRLA